MPHRNLTLGAIATAALVAGAPQIASAHTVAISCTPEQAIQLDLSLFGRGDHVGDLVVTRDGATETPVQLTWSGPALTTTIPGSPGTVSAAVVTSGRTWRSPEISACFMPAPTPTPQPTPEPTPVTVTTPTISTTPTKAETPGPRAKPPVKRPRPNCAQLRRMGAGPRTYARLGHYYRCIAPRPRIVVRVPVTG